MVELTMPMPQAQKPALYHLLYNICMQDMQNILTKQILLIQMLHMAEAEDKIVR